MKGLGVDDTLIRYVIISLLDGQRNVKAFRMKEGRAEEEILIVKEKPNESS